MFVTLIDTRFCHFVTLISETQILWIAVPSQFCQLPVTTSGKKKGRNQSDFCWKYISLYVTFSWSYSLPLRASRAVPAMNISNDRAMHEKKGTKMILYRSPEYQTSFESFDLSIQKKQLSKINDGCDGHLRFLIGANSAIFYLPVTPILPFKDSWLPKKCALCRFW